MSSLLLLVPLMAGPARLLPTHSPHWCALQCRRSRDASPATSSPASPPISAPAIAQQLAAGVRQMAAAAAAAPGADHSVRASAFSTAAAQQQRARGSHSPQGPEPSVVQRHDASVSTAGAQQPAQLQQPQQLAHPGSPGARHCGGASVPAGASPARREGSLRAWIQSAAADVPAGAGQVPAAAPADAAGAAAAQMQPAPPGAPLQS